MTGPLKRLGVAVPIIIRKLLKFIDPESFSVGLTHRHPSPGHARVSKADGSLRSRNGGGAKRESH